MYSDDLAAYAELIVAMVNIDRGRSLEIRGEPVHWDLMNEIAAAAYRRGARYVRAQSNHPGLHKARVEHSPDEYLDYVPSQLELTNRVLMDEQWALVGLKSPEDPDYLADVDTERNARISRATERATKPFRRALQADRFPWLVAANPTEGWARKVLGEGGSRRTLDVAGGEDVRASGGPDARAVSAPREELWEVMRSILRLDAEDPIAAWRDQSLRLKRRAAVLDELGVDGLRFEGPGTELFVGLPAEAVWVGGPAKTPEGLEFLPNLPTEEVFTTPDYRRTEGRVAVTRPVTVMDKVVAGAWFEFEQGRVVRFGAEKNRDVLARYLEMDEGAPYAGEIALVDAGSPIFQAGRVFYNILLDENAACHIALGGSYPGCLRGGDGLSDEELVSRGANISFVHTDFMIGSEKIQVTARTRNGREMAVLRDGRFVI
ncbi:MAG: aminopeptidase [Spirochaetaceae bacterium]